MAQTLLQKKYLEEVVPALTREFGYPNRYSVPKITRVVVNTCINNAVQDSKLIEKAVSDIKNITGQQPVITRAKKDISNFKLRAGMPLGCMTTLRRSRMYDFILRLTAIALPQVRDFKGVSRRGFDGRGNYTMGLREHGIFPEIDLNSIEQQYGMNITFVTSADNDAEGMSLLRLMGIPFRN